MREENFFETILENKRIFTFCFATVIILAVLLQLPFLSVPLERDEGEYAYIARLLLDGGVPYRDAFNQKPPVIFLLYSIAFLLFGESTEAIHLFKSLYALVAFVVFYHLSRKFFSKEVSLLAMAVLAVLVSEPAFQGNAANTEIFLLLPMILGFYFLFVFFERGNRLFLFLSGLSAGTAFMIKQIVIFPILLLMCYLFFNEMKQKGPIIKNLFIHFGIFTLGGFLPFFLTVLFFQYHSALNDFIQCAFIHNFRYSQNIPLHYYLNVFKQRMTERLLPPNVILFLVMGIGLLHSIRKFRRGRKVSLVFGYLFLLFPSVIVSGYFRPHYFLLLHPAVAILVSIGIATTVKQAIRHLKIKTSWRKILYLIIVIGILCSPVYYAREVYFLNDPILKSKAIYTINPFVAAIEIGQYLKENSEQEDTIFIFGSEPEILFYAQRRSATKYIIFYPLMSAMENSLEQQKEAYRELIASKPKYIVIVEIMESLQIYPNAEKFIMEQVHDYLQNYEIEGLVLYDEIGLGPCITGVTRRKHGSKSRAGRISGFTGGFEMQLPNHKFFGIRCGTTKGHKWLLCALMIFGACLWSCGEFSGQKPKKPSSPNLLVITLDTTRADRLGCYGYDKAETPVLDRLAKEGIRFDRAYSQVPITLPSHITLFTGTYPPEHGIRDNGYSMTAENIPTMAQVFGEHGYKTGAFVSAFVLDSMFGLDRGFETYSDQMEGDISESKSIKEIPADRVCDRALNWLEENKSQPFFCWVHFFDPHIPYKPPAPYHERYSDKYDGEIAFMDSQIARLIEWLESRSLRERTLVIVVGDHGESLGQHGEETHAFFVYDSTLRVPMIFSAPGWLITNKVVKATVGITDIFPSVMDLMAWQVPETVRGKSFSQALEGKSLKSRGVYSESDYAFNQFGWGKLRSLVKDQWHFIRAPRPELYNMDDDPKELQNLYAKHKVLAEQLDLELSSVEDVMRKSSGSQVIPDRKSIEALESLGYLHGAGSHVSTDNRKDLKDPKDMVQIYERVSYGRGLMFGENYEEAIHELKTALDAAPDSAMIHKSLAQAYERLGDNEKARHYYEKALELFPDSSDVHIALGLMLAQDGRFEEAASHYRTALKVTPESPFILLNLAYAEIALEDFQEVMKICKKNLEIKYDQPEVHYQSGMAHSRQGKIDQALSAFRTAIRFKKDYWQAHHDLGAVLAMQGEFKKAISHFETVLELNPFYPDTLMNLAYAKMALGDPQEAAEIYRKVLELKHDYPEAHYRLGKSYAIQGKYSEAVSAFYETVRLKEDYWQAYNDLGDALLNLKRFNEALKAAKRAVALMPSHPMLYLTLGECYAEKNMDDQAIKVLEMAVERGFADAGVLRSDIHLKSLEGNPKFEKMIDNIEEKLTSPPLNIQKEQIPIRSGE